MKKKSQLIYKLGFTLFLPVYMGKKPVFSIIADSNSVDQILIRVIICISSPQTVLPIPAKILFVVVVRKN